MIRLTLAAAAATALMGGAALAQSDAVPDTAVNPPPASAPTGRAVDTSATTADGRRVMLLSSPTPADQAYRLKAGDSTVVANAPVPDTLENRARYGGPQSNGGRRTSPRGN